MRKFLKRFASFFLIPLTQWYLKKERSFSYQGIKIRVPPTVFHPGLFSSSLFLLKYLERQDLRTKKLIEVGCGSGLISVVASKKGAIVSAFDLNPVAVQVTRSNAFNNQCHVDVVHSDLFDQINGQFDWIVVNPPFYAKEVINAETLAWNCGVEFEYFNKFFAQLRSHIHPNSKVIMVLTLGCNLQQIFQIANEHGFMLKVIDEKSVLFDAKNYLYQIMKIKG